ncbi:PaaI family thioesterase [Nocardia carnea]|uniref:PaaI family thioesterase n=1 Tax=Nocardia carnea TaxID=37328 RepID=UPI0032AF23C6
MAGCSRGALGVPLDDVTGFLVASGAPPGKWPVSLGIRIDLLADPPLGGPPMSVTGELIARDEKGGTTRGAVTDAEGRVIALIVQRSHLVPLAGRPAPAPVPAVAPPAGVTVREALGFRAPEPGVLKLPATPLAANGMGNLHGGILICGAEFTALSALDAAGDLRATSVDIAYVRPADPQGTTTFRGRVLHRGRSLAVVRVTAVNSSNKPCAIATVTIQG